MGGKGHSGGAWKVAYADFVTAMMALFLVLWLVAQKPEIKEAVALRFRNPAEALIRQGTGVLPENRDSGTKNSSSVYQANAVVELKLLRRMAEDLFKTLQSNPEIPDDMPMRMDLLSDGIRINLFDRNTKPLFERGSSDLSEFGEWTFTTLAWQIARVKDVFLIELEGHTEKDDISTNALRDSWDISSDRAHSARRVLLKHDIELDQISRVSGYSDKSPMKSVDGKEISEDQNRRVTVILRMKEKKTIKIQP